ncbi:phosphoribosylglycinamide formyltransferase [Altererythrobacter sp. H2]|uniref:phosphoribosylglycinamide formyltransferase n=1 Tax=Altererythrobacter sp. H2 TaxID=3108391 RepID=UPI002B4C1B51|nr:phosphoribosylglycinamide formyltransferase [Altererythrobacter sp. H2]WRK97240.1 phosphoribosylglycinamide formyltransferase [Altererythrobacter sp. H2]
MSDKARVAVFLSGAGSNMAALLHASHLPGAAYEIVLVASNDPAAPGLALAEAEGIPTFALAHKGMSRDAHDAAMEAEVLRAGADHIALAGYMRILSDGFVGRWPGRMLNIHPSLLPRYKGLDTHARAIAAGDTAGGVSVHLVTPDLDAGEVLGQLAVAIRPGETAETLAARVRMAEHQLYPHVLNRYVARHHDSDWLLARVRKLAMAMPEAEERDSHGAPGFRTSGRSGKFFAYFSDRHHGEPHIALLAKTSGVDEMTDLIARDPERFYRPAFYGASGWVGIVLNRRDTDWDQVAHWIARSWRSVAPRRLTGLLDAADAF